MPRLLVRRREATTRLRPGAALLGLALGTTLGFVLGELLGPRAARAIGRPPRGGPRSMAELVHDAQAALEADPALEGLGLEVRPVSRQTVELHGWVADRATRARAHRLVRDAIGASQVVNCILVRGEDDAEPPTLDVLSA